MYSFQYVVELPNAMSLTAATKFLNEFVAKVDSLRRETEEQYGEDLSVGAHVIEDGSDYPVV